jgi:hypothetical protein
MTHHPRRDKVTDADVLRAIEEYDQLGPDRYFSEHGFGPTTTYDLDWNERLYPPKASLGTAYEFATGQRLASGDFGALLGARDGLQCRCRYVLGGQRGSGLVRLYFDDLSPQGRQ